ncbi:hypothetical protein D3C80_1782540 [compost metagenome]
MITHALDNSHSTGVTHSETLPGNTTEITLAGDRTIKNCVADNDGVFRDNAGVFRRPNDDTSTRQTLADIVVAITNQIEGDTTCQKRTEGLPCRTSESHVDRVVFQTLVTPPLGKCA